MDFGALFLFAVFSLGVFYFLQWHFFGQYEFGGTDFLQWVLSRFIQVLFNGFVAWPLKLLIGVSLDGDYTDSPFFRVFLLMIYGSFFGILSILVWPAPFFPEAWLRWAFLALAPFWIGGICSVCALVGQSPPRYSFISGFVFALVGVGWRIALLDNAPLVALVSPLRWF